MATAAEHSYEDVKDDLALAIRKLRSDCIPTETARKLLSYETSNLVHLVGIDREGEKAVYYGLERNEVIFIRFDSEGLAAGGPVMGSFDWGVGFVGWVEKMSAYWGWLHPRYR